MAYKGINTIIVEMRQELIELTNKYLNLGVPASVVQMLQEGLVRDLSAVANEQMAQEKEQYESALEQEAKEDKQNGKDKEKQKALFI